MHIGGITLAVFISMLTGFAYYRLRTKRLLLCAVAFANFIAVEIILLVDEGLPSELPKIPQWIKTNADWWISDQISNSEFLEGIDFLFEKQIVSVPERDVISESQWNVPFWVKIPAGWWYEEKITDDDFLNIIENLVKRKIIMI